MARPLLQLLVGVVTFSRGRGIGSEGMHRTDFVCVVDRVDC